MQKTQIFISMLCLICLAGTANAGLGFLTHFISSSHPSCAHALPPHHQQFCASFQLAAQCQCQSSGLPRSMCQDMQKLHQRMITVFDTQRKACEFQQDTTTAACMDSWNCFRQGGKDSHGHLCQTTGNACKA